MIITGNTPEMNNQGCYEAVVLETCPDCSKRTLMTYGVFSNGKVELPTGYTPAPSELVKNYASVCQFCGWNQYS